MLGDVCARAPASTPPHPRWFVCVCVCVCVVVCVRVCSGAMGILLVYDVTDEQSFQNIRNWIRNIEQHAADNVDKILIGNKCDMMADKLVETARGQALADEYGQCKYFESANKTRACVVASVAR